MEAFALKRAKNFAREKAEFKDLTSAEANRLLSEYGLNEPFKIKRIGAVVEFLRLFANPLVIILLAASATYLIWSKSLKGV